MLLIVLVLLLILVLILIITWWLIRRQRRRRLRARLETGTARERVVGAWVWIGYQLARKHRTFPPDSSPDQPIPTDVLAVLPPYVAADLSELATVVAPAAYGGPEPSDDDAANAWAIADRIAHGLKSQRGLAGGAAPQEHR